MQKVHLEFINSPGNTYIFHSLFSFFIPEKYLNQIPYFSKPCRNHVRNSFHWPFQKKPVSSLILCRFLESVNSFCTHIIKFHFKLK